MSRSEVDSARRVLLRNMDEAYRLVESAPFVEIPGKDDLDFDKCIAHILTYKDMARRFNRPDKLPVLNHLEGLLRSYKNKPKNRFYVAWADDLFRIAKREGLDVGFLQHGLSVAQRMNAVNRGLSFSPGRVSKPKPFSAFNFVFGKDIRRRA